MTSTTMPACSWGLGEKHSVSATISLSSFHCQTCAAATFMTPMNHEWSKSGSRYPTFEEAEYTPSLVFTIAPDSTCVPIWGCQSTAAI